MRHKLNIPLLGIYKSSFKLLAFTMLLVTSMPVLAQETPAPTTIQSKDSIANDPAVAQVVERLKNSTEQPVNLSDVSAAQDLIARIDLLSSLQEKINKLEELKQDKKKKSNDLTALDALPMQGAISALPLPNSGNLAPAEELELVSIQGSGNNLTAYVQAGGNTVKVGPKNRMVKNYEVLEIKPTYISVKRKGDKVAKHLYLASSQ